MQGKRPGVSPGFRVPPLTLAWRTLLRSAKAPVPAGIAFLWDKSTRVPWFGIAVAEKHKGKHLGRRLIAAVREYCEQKGCGGILLTTHQNNLRAQRLYEHCGFERLGVHTNGELLYLLRF